MKSRLLKRIVGVFMAVQMGVASIPADVYAAPAVQETMESPVFAEPEVVPGGTGDVEEGADTESSGEQPDSGASEGEEEKPVSYDPVTGEAIYKEEAYPLDLLIIDPDPLVEEEVPEEVPEEIPEEESAPEEEEEEPEITDPEEPEAENATTVESGDYTYSLSNEKASITKYSGTDTELIIPSTLDGYEVVTIGDSAFSGNSTLKKVTIPDSVTLIKSNAFRNCSALESVQLPAGLETIQSYAFQNNSLLTGLQLPDSLSSIGGYAFSGCSSLTELALPASLGSVGDYAFRDSVKKITFADGITKIPNKICYGATLLESVSIPDSVTEIGTYVFYGCESLQGIVLPDSVETIGKYAFYNCVSLTELKLPESLVTINDYAFNGCRGLETISIPASVTTIGQYVFKNAVKSVTFAQGMTSIPKNACYGANLLESVSIPDSVTEMGAYAFYLCESLQGIALPDMLETIGTYTFYNCKSLSSVQLPSALTGIEANAFYNCASLTELKLPVSLVTIGNSAFSGCGGLETISIPATVTTIGQYAFKNAAKSVTFAKGMTLLPTYACYGANLLESVSMQDGLTGIGKYAFYGCTSLQTIDMPATVKEIGDYVFSGCKKLTDIRLSASLEKIGSYAFNNCSSLTEFTIPASVTSIGNYAFQNSVVKLTFADGMTQIPANACYDANLLETVVMPDSVTSIGERAFYSCDKLSNITFSKNLLTIGARAFYGCKGILAIDLPVSLQTIEEGAFYNCSNMEVIRIPEGIRTVGKSAFYNSVKSVIFADGIKNIPDNVCNGATNLTEIALPAGVESIGDYAFYGAELLTLIILPDTVKSVGIKAFYGCTLLKLYISDQLASVGEEAFSGCLIAKKCGASAEWTLNTEEAYAEVSGNGVIGDATDNIFGYYSDTVTNIGIQDGITGISDHSFEKMDELSGVVLDDSIKEIGEQAFEDCTTLKYVELSKDLENIEAKAFNGCSGLDTMVFTGDLPQIGTNALPSQNFRGYYPKTNTSYTEYNRNQYSQLYWSQWDDTMPERDIVLVLDVSGSMSGSRIETLKSAVEAFTEEVGGRIANTRIAIVTYSNEGTILLNFTTDVSRMQNGARRLYANGGTYYLKGFAEAEKLLSASKAGIRSMILFSDGAPSDSRNTILTEAEGFRDSGYYTYSVGLTPSDSNRELLINIAGDPDNYFEAENIDEMIDLFVEASGGIGRSGKCGDNVKWKYVDTDKQLQVYLDSRKDGSGKMQDYSGEAAVWSVYADTLESIVIESGVSYIGINAFSGLNKVRRINIDKSVAEIGAGAFNVTNLTDVYYSGTEEEWAQIVIGENNQGLLNANIHYNSNEINVTNMYVSPSSASIAVGETITLEAKVFPANATNPKVSWSSTDASVATVDKGIVQAKAEGKCEIVAVTEDGGILSSCKLEVIKKAPVISSFTLGGSGPELKVDKDIPFIGGATYKLDFPVELPVSCVIEDQKIKIGINIKKKNLYSGNSTEGNTTSSKEKTLKEEFEEFQWNAYKSQLMAKDKDWLKNIQDKQFLKANIPGLQKSVDISVAGYVEGAWGEGNQKLEGGVVLTLEASATVQHQTVVIWVPVTVNCEITAKGELTAKVGYDFSKAKWYGELGLLASLVLEPYAGVGFGQWLSGGVYGKATSEWDLKFLPKFYLEKWTLEGEFGLKGYFAMKSFNLPLLHSPEPLYIVNNTNGNNSADLLSEEAEAPDGVGDDELIITTLDATESLQYLKVGDDAIVVADAYNAAGPAWVTANGVSMLVYVADDKERNTYDQTKLVYSIYDETEESFRGVETVLDNGTADFSPDVYTDGKDIYVVYLDSSVSYEASADPELKDYMKGFRVRAAKFDYDTQMFTDLGSPQTIENYAYMPRACVADGNLNLVWVENANEELFGLSSSNTIRRAYYSDGKWTQADAIENLNCVTSLDINNKAEVAYVTDPDNDFESIEHSLCIRTAAGADSTIGSGAISYICYTALPGLSGEMLAANSNGGLFYVKNGALAELLPESTMNVDSKFCVSGDKLLYMKNREDSRDLAMSIYDNGQWGSAFLTEEDGYVDDFSVMNGRVVYLKSTAAVDAQGIWNVDSDIKMLHSLDYVDVELETVDFALKNVCIGKELPLDLYIRNNGTSRLTSILASVSYDGKEISSANLDVDILPGQEKVYASSFTIPSDLSAGGDFVVTLSVNDDTESANNSYTLQLMKADLEISATYDDSTEGSYINVIVENKGLCASKAQVSAKGEDGSVVFKKNITVPGGDMISFREAYTLAKAQTLTIMVEGDAEEFYEMNNTTWLIVGEGHGESEPAEENDEAFSVSFTGLASDPYEGLYFNESNERYEIAYTGAAIKPQIEVNGRNGQLREGIDYTVTYSNNKNYDKKGRPASVSIKGKGNFSGKKVLEFYIVQADLAKAMDKGLLITADEITVVSGKKARPELIYCGKLLKASDINLSDKAAIKADTQITIEGKGNFRGKLSNVPVKVVSAKEAKQYAIKAVLKANAHSYNGEEQTLSCSSSGTKGELTVTAGASGDVLREGVDFELQYSANTEAGTARVLVSGKGEYFGSVSRSFKIAPDKNAVIRTELAEAEIVYDPRGVYPEVKVLKELEDGSTELLERGKDYSISYAKNKSAGSGMYSIKFIGNYKGHKAIKKVKFTIGEADIEAANVIAADLVYTKAGKYQSEPYVMIDGVKLTTKDYTVEYYDGSKKLGSKLSLADGEKDREITIKITGKGNYKSQVISTSYHVLRADEDVIDLSKAVIVAKEQVKGKDVSVGKQEYSGAGIEPEIRVLLKDGKNTVEVPDSDYTLTYINNIEKGSAVILVSGNGSDTVGSCTAKFTITVKKLN